MSTMLLPVRKRTDDSKIIKLIRKEYCELCGQKATGEPHHIRPRSLRGDDVPENLIQLCFNCHRLYHDGKISHHQLIPIVAKREEKEIKEIYNLTGWPIPETMPEPTDYTAPSHIDTQVKTLEDIIQMYINLEEQERECRWAKGQLLDLMIKMGAKIGWIASQVGTSKAQIRELIKTYRAFPEEEDRNPELSWMHHRIAANSENPKEWIEIAANEQMSTRQLRKAIKESVGESTESEEEKELQEAKKVFVKVEEIITRGGPASKWLREKLKELED